MRILLSASALVLTLSVSAFAAPSNRYEIRYNSDELTIQSGVERLERQIRNAAENVCNADSARSLTEIRIARECVSESERRALDVLHERVRNANSENGSITVASR
ncbi:UrcA family protein [Woodsholea maritima]|uniref:UrcA family protein n=1 Tax=Woodsholea maritima TaxID=240237 RepID=UPI00035E6026|nr:UrcA family protein [Woodsholea maritima]